MKNNDNAKKYDNNNGGKNPKKRQNHTFPTRRKKMKLHENKTSPKNLQK